MMQEEDSSEPEITCHNEAEYSATLDGEEAGSLTLYWDEASKTYWINHIETEEHYRRRGIATALLRAAIAEHKIIYASTQLSDEDEGEDTRHLLSDGMALVAGLIKKGLAGLVLMHPDDAPAHGLPAPPQQHGQRLITDYFQPRQ
jgi:predicted GNAT family acetyltransferase